MTIKQAFTFWAVSPGNTVLAARSRDAVNIVLIKKYGDIELEQITEDFARQIFDEARAPQEYKTKAASILVYLLKWGSEHDYCQSPAFDYSIASPTNQEITSMEERKTKCGKQPKKVCALDPDTLQVVCTYESITEACQKNKIKNLNRPIKEHHKAAGFYWAFPEDVEGFKPKTYSIPEEMKQKTQQKLDITQISDEDLIKEIKRRGWTGELSITKKVNL